MGKTSLFGRRASKAPSDRGSPTNSQGSGGGEEKKKKSSRDKSQARAESGGGGQKAKLVGEKKKETPRVDKRQTRDKAKQLSENKNSLRRMKKREEVKNLVHRLPSEVKSSRSSATGGLYDSILSNGDYVGSQDIGVERGLKEKEIENDSDAESIYESRKLLIRQMQGQIAKQVHEGRDSVSEYDSWTDLEENFALAYEPIPLSIKMATWRKMTKREILRKVNSKKIRKDFEYMSHGEILDQIEKMQKNAIYLKTKFGIGHLMPQQAHVAMVHRAAGRGQVDASEEEEEEEGDQEEDDAVAESDGNISRASFVSGKEIYLSRAEILGKIHKRGGGGGGGGPTRRRVEKENVQKPRPKGVTRHDSWSSRASSILKDPEAIYVSRVELLKKIDVHEEGRERGGRKVRQHDSWSSRASSILAAVEAEQDTLADDEPLYISRVELLEKLQLKSLAALSAASGTSADSDSDASTVKNVPLKMNSPGQRKWKVQNMQFHKDLDSAKHVSSKVELVNGGNNNNNNNNNMINNNNHKTSAMNDRGQESPKDKKGSNRPSSKNGDYPRNIREREKKYEPKQSHPEKPREPENRRLDQHPHSQHDQHVHDEDSDSCSCVTCNTCHLSDCSCSEMSSASHSSRSSHSSDGSVETVVGQDDIRAREKELGARLNRKHSDIYIVNGSDVSKASSKASTKISKKSSNYDPLPQNGITKVKHKKLSQSEIEHERVLNEQEIRLRSIADSEHRRQERQVKKPGSRSSREGKGTVKSSGSWTNEEFGKIYEPVSATELRRQHQVKELKKQLQNLSPEWDRTVESISTMRRKKVLRQLKAVVTHNVDMENISEEDLGKHLDKALRHALDVNYEELKKLNLGAMYVPMEKNPANSKAVSRENTDYDTFGSIDSLIFEPKIPTEEDIEEVQEEITQSFEYLENEDDGQDIKEKEDLTPFERIQKDNKRSPRFNKNAMAVGKTTFAERVRLFQSLGDKKPSNGADAKDDPLQDHDAAKRQGQTKTTWKEQALQKPDRSGRESVASNISHSTNSSGSTVIYNVTIAESVEENNGKAVNKGKEPFLEESPSGERIGGRSSQEPGTGECSTCTSLSCECLDEEGPDGEEGCSCEDCPGCNQPTLRKFVESSRGSSGSPTYSRPVSEARERRPSKRRESLSSSARKSSGSRRSSESSREERSASSPEIKNVRSPSKRRESHGSPSKQSGKSSPSDRRDSSSSPQQKSEKSSPKSKVIQKKSPSLRGPMSTNRVESPVLHQDMENYIPVVGNLRRQLRENFNKPSLNIEKKKPKKGIIVEDAEDDIPRAPSTENVRGMSKAVQERIERVDSFQKLQTRDQFRSTTPEAPPPPASKNLGLLVQVQDGKPLIFDQHQPEQSPEYGDREMEAMKPFSLDSPKGKGSEMGDSGISSNPASMSPHGSSTSSGSSASPVEAEDKNPALLKKLVPPGGKKRDTMIRELKFKLKERFPEERPTPTSSNHRRPNGRENDAVRSQRSEVGPKLTKIFGALMSEAGQGPGQATLLRQQRAPKREEPQARNLGVPQDDISTLRSSRLATVKEFECQDSLCPSIYDPSLPPGMEQHIELSSPPPAPPPTQESSKRSSVLNDSYEEASIPSRPNSENAAPIDRHELLYGPGGIFGPKGPFSTPGVSRYPEVASSAKTAATRVPPPKSSSTSMTEESSGLFDGDRSDKSQYICNPVMTLPEIDPFVSSRLENYRARVSPESPVELSVEQVAALSNPNAREVER